MPVQPIPDDYRAVTPYLIINGAARAIEFYQQAFGATEFMRMPGPGGKLMHAEVRIGTAPVMLADEFVEWGVVGPDPARRSPVMLLLYVTDVDAVVARALAAGATMLRPVQDQFYGDRTGTIVDPFGHCWTIATHTEDVPPEELGRRAAAMKPECGQG